MTSSFSPALLALAADPSAITPLALWQALSRDDRVKAILVSLNGDDGQGMREYFAGVLVERRGGFRASTIRKWSKEEVAASIAKERLTRPGMVRGLLVDLHFPARAHIQAAFLDDLGVPHENGQSGDALKEGAVREEAIPGAADRLIAKFPDDQGLFYLLTIWCMEPRIWRGLDGWLRRLAAPTAAS